MSFYLCIVIASKGRESDYEAVKEDVMKVLSELNVMIGLHAARLV